MEGPPTRQLFVRFTGHRPRDLDEVEEIFGQIGPLKYCHLMAQHDLAFVHYWHTRDALEAKKLDGAIRRGILLNIEFNRPARLIKLDRPPHLSSDYVLTILCQRIPYYSWMDFSGDKRAVFVMLPSLTDAIDVVRKWQANEDVPEWKFEIEFAKVS